MSLCSDLADASFIPTSNTSQPTLIFPCRPFATATCFLSLLTTLILLPSPAFLHAQPPTSSSPQPPINQPPASIRFNQDVRPILADACFACHGPDASHRQGDLRLDLRDEAIAKGAIIPGDPQSSQLWDRIHQEDESLVMPPPSSHKKLHSHQRHILKTWIEEGAIYETHWSFSPPTASPVPMQSNPVDHWLQQRWNERNITPAPPADPRTLIRRLKMDLLGLPPTPAEVDALIADPSPNAYAALVEQYLDDPHYGERMALGWLDVVRYADTIGYHSDNPRNVWPYRDWVIHAFQANMPFDQFTIHQLAGDLLPHPTSDSRVASAFNRLVQSTEEGGAQPKDYESRMLADRVRAVGTVWLGLTTGCAQCHDHKFDPFTANDFYSLGAFFADIEEKAIGEREPGMLVLSPEQQQQLADLDRTLEVAQKTLKSNGDSPSEAMMAAVESARQARKAFVQQVPKCLVSVSAKNPRTVRFLPRGNWQDESGPIMKPRFPNFLDPSQPSRDLTRLDLAQWLVHDQHPLTARVFVNRLWRQFFGEGLCRTPNDLGLQGDLPNQQALLDGLARHWIQSGWNIKQLVRQIVMSHAYRMSSHASPDTLAKDPENREFARQGRYRLDAEFLRDQALAVSGLLNPTIGGPSIKPYQPEGYWDYLNFPARKYEPDPGPNQYRRGLYVWWQRSFLHPSLLAFDAPSREECAAERSRSNIPQQALVLMNDPSYVESHRALAERLLRSQKTVSIESHIEWLMQTTLQRLPSDSEKETLRNLVDQQRQAYTQNPSLRDAWLHVGLHPVPQDIDLTELATWTHVARVLMNTHEFVTRY